GQPFSGASAGISDPHFGQSLGALIIAGESLTRSLSFLLRKMLSEVTPGLLEPPKPFGAHALGILFLGVVFRQFWVGRRFLSGSKIMSILLCVRSLTTEKTGSVSLASAVAWFLLHRPL